MLPHLPSPTLLQSITHPREGIRPFVRPPPTLSSPLQTHHSHHLTSSQLDTSPHHTLHPHLTALTTTTTTPTHHQNHRHSLHCPPCANHMKYGTDARGAIMVEFSGVSVKYFTVRHSLTRHSHRSSTNREGAATVV